MKEKGHLIQAVEEGGIAEEMGIEPGDRLLEINGETVEDIFDYQYMIEEEYVEVLIAKPSGEEWLLEIDKDYEEDLGVTFDNGLMDDYRSCTNKCIFCFIDQMPKGMRETLYFKDDDSRLSFLQGNYVTLTNMSERMWTGLSSITCPLSIFPSRRPIRNCAAGCFITGLRESR